MSSTRSLELAIALGRVRARVVRDMDRALGGGHGVGLHDLALLRELADAPGQKLTRADLADRLAVTTSGVHRQLGPLERIGLVDREPSPGDARLVLVVLTLAGAQLVDDASVTASEAADRALGRYWSTDQQDQLLDLLGSPSRST